MTPMRESPPTRPCSIPTSKSRETAPKARGGPSQETRTSLRDGTARAQAVGSDQAVLVLQPSAAARVCPRSDPEGPGAETPEVCWPKPEDRHTEGRQA
uniref:MOK protein kinase n=1 Tax=Balaenoptera musculus TaxID=9771 RepID=A0A8C0HX65_BALMU